MVLSLICLWSRPEVTKVCFHRKVHSAPNKLNTIFQQPDPKDRPQISDPTLMETTATQATTPLMLTPSRPPPQVQQSTSSQSALNWEQWTYCGLFWFTATKEILYTTSNITHRSGKLPYRCLTFVNFYFTILKEFFYICLSGSYIRVCSNKVACCPRQPSLWYDCDLGQ